MPARKIRYSKHLELRLALRAIPRTIPSVVYDHADRHVLDTSTGLRVAVQRRVFGGKRREIAVAYRHVNGDVLLVTIYPLKVRQVENRLRSGRWREIIAS